MPTPLEIARDRETRKLRQHGLTPDGKPVNQNPANDPADDDDDAPLNLGGGDPADDLLGDDPPNLGGDPNGDGGENSLQAQVADLQRQLLALQGRVGPAQRSADENRQLAQLEREQRERERAELQARIDALEEQLARKTEPFSLQSVLSEDEIRDIDPLVLSAATKIAEALVKKNIPKVDVRAETLKTLQERETQRVAQYRVKVLSEPTRGLHKLAQLAYDPEFIAWSREDDNDVDSVVASLMAASSTEEIDRYAKIVAKRINAFQTRKKAPPTDARPSLSGHMRRGERPRLTEAEINAKINQAKQLARSRNPADRAKAQAILNDLK